MPQVVANLVDANPYRRSAVRRRANAEILVLRRAAGKIYEGEWRMVGGKIAAGETAGEAALREVAEETGIVPELMVGAELAHAVPVSWKVSL